MEERLINIKEFRSHFGKSGSVGVVIRMTTALTERRSKLLDVAVSGIATPRYRAHTTYFHHTDSIERYASNNRGTVGRCFYVAGESLNRHAGHIIGFGGMMTNIDNRDVPEFIPRWGRIWKND